MASWALVGFSQAGIENLDVDGVNYRLLRASPESVRIVWKDDQDVPLRTFQAASQFLSNDKNRVVALMNGGIFEPGGVPSGLLVQNGKELRPVNRNKGEGNFFLQPNGVFVISDAGAAVIRTDEYPPRDRKILHAVQSGPLLLRVGKVHPEFNQGSSSRLLRNGVGVTKKGQVILVITDFNSPKLPNLYEFAQLFKLLGCDDALFLDGDISQLRAGDDLEKRSNQFGSIIAVIEPLETKSSTK